MVRSELSLMQKDERLKANPLVGVADLEGAIAKWVVECNGGSRDLGQLVKLIDTFGTTWKTAPQACQTAFSEV